MKYFTIIVLIIFSSYSSAYEQEIKVRVFGGVIKLPSNCVLHVKPSLNEENRVRYICETITDTDVTSTHISISNFSTTKFEELKLEKGITDFRVSQINGFDYYTANYKFTVAENETINTQFNFVCDRDYCLNINSTDKNILRKFLAQFGIKYV